MDELTDWVYEGRVDGYSEAQKRFLIQNQPGPLSPMWEAFIDGYWRPWCQRYLFIYSSETLRQTKIKDQTMMLDVKYHAFNFSNAAVNNLRASNFVASLRCARDLGTPRDAPPPWWPQDAASMLKAIKQERDDMNTLGYIKSVASARSQGDLCADTAEVQDEALAQAKTTTTTKRKRSAATPSACS